MISLKTAFLNGYRTTVNSQDPTNDNRETGSNRRVAFEIGAYFMRAELDIPSRVELGPWRDNERTIFVDGSLYVVRETMGGCEVCQIEGN